MKKITRLTIALSIFWIVAAYPSIYLYNMKSANQSADFLLSYCKSMQSVYTAPEYMETCKKDRDEIYEKEITDNGIVSLVLTVIPLIIFLIVGYIFRKTYIWIRSGT